MQKKRGRKKRVRINYARFFGLILAIFCLVACLIFLVGYLFKDKFVDKGYSKTQAQVFRLQSYEYQKVILEDSKTDQRYYLVLSHPQFKQEKALDYASMIKDTAETFKVDDLVTSVNQGYSYQYYLELKNNIFSKDPYYLERNYQRYKAYSQNSVNFDEKDSASIRDIVASVNCNLDLDENTVLEADLSKKHLVLVNKYYALPKDYSPSDLVSYDLHYGKDTIKEEVYQAFKDMADEVSKLNMRIYANSSYRNYDLQKEIYDEHLESYGYEGAESLAAKAGHSEHQTGYVIDIIAIQEDGGLVAFEFTKEYAWMRDNAHKYGFIQHYKKGQEKYTRYANEPWHYRYVGKEVATFLYEHPDLTFDEYYEVYVK